MSRDQLIEALRARKEAIHVLWFGTCPVLNAASYDKFAESYRLACNRYYRAIVWLH